MEYKNIVYSKSDGVATIKFNRPDAFNALSVATWKEMNAALDDVESDEGVKAVILTGEGNAFSAGDDIAEFQEISQAADSIKEFVQLVIGTMVRLEQLPRPVIAAVNGLAMGGGCELTLASDITIASEKAKFGLPEAMISAFAGFAVDRLPKMIGTKKAAELTLTGSPIDANEAYRLGIVNKVVAPEELEAESIKMAKQIGQLAPLAARATKKQVNKTRGEFDLDGCVEVALSLLTSEDFKEGFDAFMNKRTPVYKGK